VEENFQRLADALERADVRHRLLFALKANRHPAILSRIRKMGNVGIDVCSPNEVSAALEAGWKAGEISYTGTSLSLWVLFIHPGGPCLRYRPNSRDDQAASCHS
jgi:diaminopimelate decarboxylase